MEASREFAVNYSGVFSTITEILVKLLFSDRRSLAQHGSLDELCQRINGNLQWKSTYPFDPLFSARYDSQLNGEKKQVLEENRRQSITKPFKGEEASDFASSTSTRYEGTFTFNNSVAKAPQSTPLNYFNGWDDEESAVFLTSSLRGEAQKVMSGLSDIDCRDYKKIVGRLEVRFGVEKQRELYQARLHSRRQTEGESAQALAADIRFSMSSLAYQDLTPEVQ